MQSFQTCSNATRLVICCSTVVHEIMDTQQIDTVWFSDPYLSNNFRGTSPIYFQPRGQHGAYIINLSDSKNEGSHWVAAHVNHN